MSTPYMTLIEAFFKRIEQDRYFFNYPKLTDVESMELAKQRAKNFLFEAIDILTFSTNPDIDFYDVDNETECFNVDLTKKEIFLLSSLMYQQYLERDFAKLKCLSVNYTPTELRVFDSSNTRSTFMSIYKTVCNTNERLIHDYESRDRLTGELKVV